MMVDLNVTITDATALIQTALTAMYQRSAHPPWYEQIRRAAPLVPAALGTGLVVGVAL